VLSQDGGDRGGCVDAAPGVLATGPPAGASTCAPPSSPAVSGDADGLGPGSGGRPDSASSVASSVGLIVVAQAIHGAGSAPAHSPRPPIAAARRLAEGRHPATASWSTASGDPCRSAGRTSTAAQTNAKTMTMGKVSHLRHAGLRRKNVTRKRHYGTWVRWNAPRCETKAGSIDPLKGRRGGARAAHVRPAPPSGNRQALTGGATPGDRRSAPPSRPPSYLHVAYHVRQRSSSCCVPILLLAAPIPPSPAGRGRGLTVTRVVVLAPRGDLQRLPGGSASSSCPHRSVFASPRRLRSLPSHVTTPDSPSPAVFAECRAADARVEMPRCGSRRALRRTPTTSPRDGLDRRLEFGQAVPPSRSMRLRRCSGARELVSVARGRGAPGA